MKLFTLAEQRRRFDNLAFAHGAVKSCLVKHQVHDYIPGQAIYNLGEYPRRVSAAPTEYDEHPDGPYTYSEWSSVPDDVAHRERWVEYMALYRPMVEEGSHAYIDISESTLLCGKKPESLLMSLFVNSECYLVVSNVGDKTEAVTLTEEWLDRQSGKPVRELTLAPCTLAYLKKI